MSDEAKVAPADALTLAFFRLATIQAQNTMRLSFALRNDQGVSEETRKAAVDAFESVQEMLNLLDEITHAAWGLKAGTENEND